VGSMRSTRVNVQSAAPYSMRSLTSARASRTAAAPPSLHGRFGTSSSAEFVHRVYEIANG
jgi:hypothetical protein